MKMNKDIYKKTVYWAILGLSVFFFLGCGSSLKRSDQFNLEKKKQTQKRKSPKKNQGSVERRYRQLSKAYESRNEAEFLKEVAELLSENKNDLKALNLLALHHLRKKRLGLSRTVLARALKSHSRDASLYNNLGVIDLLEGETEAAMSQFKQALKLNSRNFAANMNLASIYVNNESFAKASPLLKQASEEKGKDLQVLNLYGLSLVEINNFSLARKTYKKAVGLGTSLENHMNYAILLVDGLSDSKMGLEEIKKIRLRGPNSKQLKILDSLEKKILSKRKKK